MQQKNNIHFDVAKCVTAGNGFEQGHFYATVRYNDEIHILKAGRNGDLENHHFMTGGVGQGLFNNWDSSGAPSFMPVYLSPGSSDKADERFYKFTILMASELSEYENIGSVEECRRAMEFWHKAREIFDAN